MAETSMGSAHADQNDTHLTAAGLKIRGWTDTAIRDLLGPCDLNRPNPHCRSGPPMRLYCQTRVEAAETSAAWTARAAKTRVRQEAAVRAVETKRVKMWVYLESVAITVPALAHLDLTQEACDHYNQRQFIFGNWYQEEATPTSDAMFISRITVNYLRHALTEYDDELTSVFGKVGVRDGYQEISRKVFEAISVAYPLLANECQRQYNAKFAGAAG